MLCGVCVFVLNQQLKPDSIGQSTNSSYQHQQRANQALHPLAAVLFLLGSNIHVLIVGYSRTNTRPLIRRVRRRGGYTDGQERTNRGIIAANGIPIATGITAKPPIQPSWRPRGRPPGKGKSKALVAKKPAAPRRKVSRALLKGTKKPLVTKEGCGTLAKTTTRWWSNQERQSSTFNY